MKTAAEGGKEVTDGLVTRRDRNGPHVRRTDPRTCGPNPPVHGRIRPTGNALRAIPESPILVLPGWDPRVNDVGVQMRRTLEGLGSSHLAGAPEGRLRV